MDVSLAVALATDPVDPVESVEATRPYLVQTAKFLVGFAVVYLLGRFTLATGVVSVIRRRNPNNPTMQEAATRYLHALVLVVALAVAVASAGFGQILTNSALVVAAGTLAVGVAGQEVLGALVSGIFLVGDPNFNVGDWIAWDETEGVVESITLRVTRVRTPNNEVVTVPNTELTANSVTRPYGRAEFRLTERLGIDYDDDVDAGIDLFRTTVSDHAAVLDDPAPKVYVEELGGDEVVLRADFWIRNPNRRDVLSVHSGVIRTLKERFEAAGFTVSPPSHHDVRGRVAVDGDAEGSDGPA